MIDSENAVTNELFDSGAQESRFDIVAEVGLQKVLNVSRIDCTNLAQLRPGS